MIGIALDDCDYICWSFFTYGAHAGFKEELTSQLMLQRG